MRALLFLLALTLVFSCKEKTSKTEEVMDQSIEIAEQSEPMAHAGEKLLATYCYTCHSPEASEDNMLAPPMIAIKNHYIGEDTNKEEFVANLLEWMKKPQEENSKIPGALEKFGLMPHQVYPDSVITAIGEYLYENEVQEPDWYQAHREKMYGKGAGKGKGQKKGGS